MVEFGTNSGVELRSIETPNVAIPPGGTFEVVANLFNHSSTIFLDQDGCSNEGTPCSGKDGYCITVYANVGNNQTSQTGCLNLPITGIPPNQENWSLSLTAPQQEGQYTVFASAEASNSGNTSPSDVAATISVSEDATPVPDDDNGGEDGNANLINWAMDNPGPALALGGLSIVATRTAVESLLGE